MNRLVSRIARAVLVVSVTGVLYVALTAFEVWRVGLVDRAVTADAIVVMGAAQYDGRPSPQLAARLDHAAELWKSGAAPFIIVTGGNQPGDRFTEAEASQKYLASLGVPESAVRQEATSRSTWEALSNLRRLAEEPAWTVPLDSIVVVTDPFHSLRSRLIAEENGFDAATSATASSPVSGTKAVMRHVKEGVGVAVGRIIGFGTLWKVTG